jgi:Chagasin family peptidase inhibitor I42
VSVFQHPPLVIESVVAHEVVIELEATPGAAMMWQRPNPPAGCQLSEGEIVPKPGSAIGGQALQRFVFCCVRPGQVELLFELKRPWESEVRAVQQVTVKLL